MSIDWWTLALQAANFLILVWLLQRFLYRPVLAIIARRQQETDAVMAEAAASRQAAAVLERELSEQRTRITAERDHALEAAHADAAAERTALLDRARGEAEALVAEARARIGREEDAAQRGLRERTARLAVDLAGRLLAIPAGGDLNAPFFAAACAAIAAMSATERQALVPGDGAGAAVRVVTATALAGEEQERLRQRLAALFGTEVMVEFAADRGLIAGVELHLPHGVLRHNWRDRLAQASEDLTAEALTATDLTAETLAPKEQTADDHADRGA